MVGIFFVFDILVVWFITACYLLCPKSIVGNKNEYVKFFLIFLSIYFFIIQAVAFFRQDMVNFAISGEDPRDFLMFLFIMGFCPALFIANLVYPFKTVKRSRHLSFFTFLISLCSIGIFTVIWVFGTFFNNM
jgi:hypothetical protein